MFKPFDVITGSSFGGVTDREMAAAIISAMPDMDTMAYAALWEDLARTHDGEIDLDGWTDELVERAETAELLPPYCALIWEDNELRVLPCVESALEDCPRGDELPDSDACSAEFFCVVSDHGNVTLYRASEQDGTPNPSGAYWREVWAVV